MLAGNSSLLKIGVPTIRLNSWLPPIVVFINGIVDLNTNIRLFVDDTSLYITVDTPQNAA